MIVYIHKAFTGYVVYGSMNFSMDHKGKWKDYWSSTSVWYVWGDCE